MLALHRGFVLFALAFAAVGAQHAVPALANSNCAPSTHRRVAWAFVPLASAGAFDSSLVRCSAGILPALLTLISN